MLHVFYVEHCILFGNLQIMMNYLRKEILLGFDTDGAENLLNVLGVDLVAGEGGEESGGHVTHF